MSVGIPKICPVAGMWKVVPPSYPVLLLSGKKVDIVRHGRSSQQQ